MTPQEKRIYKKLNNIRNGKNEKKDSYTYLNELAALQHYNSVEEMVYSKKHNENKKK